MGSAVQVQDRAGLGPAALASLEAAVAGHETLEDLLRWGRAQVPPVLIEQLVTQDEFTHDVLVPWPDGLTLVYDTT
jgi:hypothetical protein